MSRVASKRRGLVNLITPSLRGDNRGDVKGYGVGIPARPNALIEALKPIAMTSPASERYGLTYRGNKLSDNKAIGFKTRHPSKAPNLKETTWTT
jgi:hypothetical protein